MFDQQVPQCDPGAGYAAEHTAVDAAISRVLRSGRYILGEEVASFEKEFADYVGRKHCVGVASGTDALVASVRMLDPAPDHYVISVSHTSVATIAAIELAGARPLLIDISPTTLTLDPEELRQVLERPPGKIAAILVVHLYGQPADMDAILSLAHRHGVPVIEDCAQSHGARLGEQTLGTLGRIATFSFYPTKNLGALGDGGAVLVDDPGLAERLRGYRQYGWTTPQMAEFRGTCSRLDELQAAILRVRLPQLNQQNERRRAIAARYTSAFADLPLCTPWVPSRAHAVYHQYVLRTPRRDALRAALQRLGVGTGIHYPTPVHLQPAYHGRVATGPAGLEHSERAASEVLSLPMFPQLSDAQIEFVIRAVREACVDLPRNPATATGSTGGHRRE